MTLGERIQQLRKEKHYSQEELGALLGVSRQAVSKWETGQTLPDTANLLAMADLFGVSMDELAEIRQTAVRETPVPLSEPLPPSAMEHTAGASHKVRRIFIWTTLLVCIAAGLLLGLRWLSPTSGHIPSGSSSLQTEDSLSEFSLLWENTSGETEQLSLGVQEVMFPFHTSLRLTERDWSYFGDDARVEYHDADCGAIHLTYSHITDSGDPRGEWESIDSISLMAAGYEHTPRGIFIGTPKDKLMEAYGDDLIYCMKESGSDILVRHDCYYAWQALDPAGSAAAILFYMQDGHVAGIKLERLGDFGLDAYAPNNTSRFPVVHGEPDFSQRVEPEPEDVDETRAIYIAFCTLTTDTNLSGEEQYQCRRVIFENLQHLDWQAYGQLGEAGKEDQTKEDLLVWLQTLGDFSQDELLYLQLGCASNLDGWLSEDYCSALANAFFLYPIQFTQLLANNENSVEASRTVVLSTVYGTDLYPEQESLALDQLRRYGLTGREGAWAAYLIDCMEAPLGEAYQIPLPDEVY